MKIWKRMGCVLLTLALCMGLLPGTALADTTNAVSGNLDFVNILLRYDADSSDIATGYSYDWKHNDKKLELKLDNVKIDGDITFPRGTQIRIELTGKNEITGDIDFGEFSGLAGDTSTLIITNSGNLTINGEIEGGAQSHQNYDKLIVEQNAEVITRNLSLGKNDGVDGYLEVRNGGSLIVKDDMVPVSLTDIVVSDSANVTLAGGLVVTNTEDSTATGTLPRIYIDDPSCSIILGTDGGNGAALRTILNVTTYFPGNSLLKTILEDTLENYLKHNDAYAEYKVPLIGSNISASDYYIIWDANRSPSNYLELRMPESTDDSTGEIIPPTGNGDADGDNDGGNGGGAHRTHWYEIKAIQPIGGSIDVVEEERKNIAVDVTVYVEKGYVCKGILVTDGKGKAYTVRPQADDTFQFTMPDKDVTVEAILEEVGAQENTQDYIQLALDSPQAWLCHRWEMSDAAPVLHAGGVLLPMRFLVEALGDTVDVTANVEDGYLCKGIIVTDGEGEAYTVRPQADGTFQFTIPDADVTAEAFLKKAETQENIYIRLAMDSPQACLSYRWKTLDVTPVLREGRVMLPARFIIEALGGTVAWDADAQEVTIRKDGKTIVIPIGAAYALVDGAEIALDSPAFLENGRTYLPIRFIAENLGANVTWDAATIQVKIYLTHSAEK